MSPKLKYHWNWNVIITEVSLKSKYCQKLGVKTETSPRLKSHPKRSATKTEMAPKLKCLQNQNVTKTEMLSN